MICEETSKIGFFCDSVALTRDGGRWKTVSEGVIRAQNSGIRCICEADAAVDRYRSANRMFLLVPPWKGGTFISGPRNAFTQSMREECRAAA